MQFRSQAVQTFVGLIATFLLCLIGWFIGQTWLTINATLNNESPQNTQITFSYFLTDEALLPQTVLQRDFIKSSFEDAPSNLTTPYQWFRVAISNDISVPQDLVVFLDNPLADEISIYEIKDNNDVHFLTELGDKVNVLTTEYRVLPHIDLTVAESGSTELLIEFSNDGSNLAPIRVMHHADFDEYLQTIHLIWGGFIGIVLLMTAYNLILFIALRDKAYISYVGYVLSMLVLLGLTHGYGYYLFEEDIQRWMSDNNMAFNSLAGYFTISFAVNYLRITASDGRVYYFSKAVANSILLFSFLSLFLVEYVAGMAFALVQLFAYICVGWLVSKRLSAEYSWARFYLISWIPFCFGAAVGYGLYIGLVEYNFISRHLFISTVIFEMTFISMGLASRLGEIERNRVHLSTHDQRFGLPNESMLENAITTYIDKVGRTKFHVITVDIANYDLVAPYLTNATAKKLVQAIADSLRLTLRKHLSLMTIDTNESSEGKCAVIQGQVLAFIVIGATSSSIRSVLEELSNVDNFNPLQATIPYRIHCVFGVASSKHSIISEYDTVKNAKRAVGVAVSLNEPFHFYDPDSGLANKRKVQLAQDLGNAIAEGSLELYHQPQISVHNQNLLMSEVLLRWHHADLGFISPDEIIEIAEDTGLIRRLTIWVIEQAFIQSEILISNNNSAYEVSINVSASDLSRPTFNKEVIALLNKYKLNAAMFTLEVTETTNLKNVKAFKNNLQLLADYGFKLALDDFGTGYSSLTYANEHPFSELKIDRSFINDMLNSSKKMAIVTATISMAQDIGLKVTAEGVEDKETYHALKTMNCDKIQGYLIEKPMTFDNYKQWQFDSRRFSTEIGETLFLNFNLKPFS